MYSIITGHKKSLIQVVVLSIVALLVHGIVLKFIYPGYYSPLYPNHSDFYIPVAMANSPDDFFQFKYLGYSRPIGLFSLKFIGLFGTKGAILFTIINVALNVSLTVILFTRLLNIEFKWPFVVAFCIYSYLLFSQAYFYNYYTHDTFAHSSYFFLIAAACCYYMLYKTHRLWAHIILFTFELLAFLSKETYALSVLFLTFLWFIYYRKKSFLTAISPFLLTVAVVVLIAAFNLIIKSTFVNLQHGSKDPYYVNLTPASVLSEMLAYFHEGLNWLNRLIVAFFAYLAIKYYRRSQLDISLIFAGCIIATFLSWLPNALIPNHHYGGYSFNGLYLLYLPIIYCSKFWSEKAGVRWLAITLLVACLLTPVLNKKEYAKQWWDLEQENTQRNILKSLDTLIPQINSPVQTKKILITGLTMPFYPFHHAGSLKEYRNSGQATYDVINYSQELPTERDNGVKFIKPQQVEINQYDMVWLFANNGLLLRKLPLTPQLADSIVKNNGIDLIINPDNEKNEKLSVLISRLQQANKIQ